MDLRILVTGGAGYIGAILVGDLLGHGHAVTVLDNLLYKQQSLFHYCSHPKFEFIRGDARDDGALKRLLRTHDVIIPLAAIVGAHACDSDPVLAKSVNHEAIRLLNRLRDPGQWVIFPCTNSGYGTKTGDVYCTEETELEPISLDGVTKVAAERELLDSGNAVTLRLATVFGVSPRMRLDLLVNDFVYKAVTQGSLILYEPHFKRNYIHIEDVAHCFVYAIEHFDKMKNEPYNVGLNDANLSKAELALKIREHWPRLYIHEAAIGEDPDKRNYIVANDKINSRGFVTAHTLDEGIEQLIMAYRMVPATNFYNA